MATKGESQQYAHIGDTPKKDLGRLTVKEWTDVYYAKSWINKEKDKNARKKTWYLARWNADEKALQKTKKTVYDVKASVHNADTILTSIWAASNTATVL